MGWCCRPPLAYTWIVLALTAIHDQASAAAATSGRDLKGRLSLASYALAIPLAFVSPWISGAL